jgi:phosphoglycolate phosphatase-like HAD superfamily hydrolase
MEGIPFAGRTDCAIVGDALSSIGQAPTPGAIAAVRDAYLQVLPEELRRPSDEPSCVLPGVAALLADLSTTAGTHVGLLTGNFERGAALKLGHFGLWTAFPFGAFGDAQRDRPDLLPLAIARAQQAGVPVASDWRIVVVGDTPHDVACAHAHGACAVAVATGHYDRHALTATGADIVVGTLAELTSFE